MWIYNFSFKIGCKTRTLEFETWCNIITHLKLLHTLWEIQISENVPWVEDGSVHLLIVHTYKNYMGAVGIADDVQVFGNEENHDRNFQESVECIGRTGIKFNFGKRIIKTKCCSIFGNLCTLEGVKHDMKKVEANKQMQSPINKQLSFFLGMVNHLFHYICQTFLT